MIIYNMKIQFVVISRFLVLILQYIFFYKEVNDILTYPLIQILSKDFRVLTCKRLFVLAFVINLL